MRELTKDDKTVLILILAFGVGLAFVFLGVRYMEKELVYDNGQVFEAEVIGYQDIPRKYIFHNQTRLCQVFLNYHQYLAGYNRGTWPMPDMDQLGECNAKIGDIIKVKIYRDYAIIQE